MPTLVSVKQYAAMRGVTRQAVTKAARAGRIVLHNGMVNPEEADADWSRNSVHMRKSGGGRPRRDSGPPPESPNVLQGIPSLATSNAMRTAWLARLARLDYERRSGKLVELDLVRRHAFESARRARDLLMAIPDRAAPLITGLSDQAEVHRIIREEVERAVQELQREYRGTGRPA